MKFKVGDIVLSNGMFINKILSIPKGHYYFTELAEKRKYWKIHDREVFCSREPIECFEDRSVLLSDELKAELL